MVSIKWIYKLTFHFCFYPTKKKNNFWPEYLLPLPTPKLFCLDVTLLTTATTTSVPTCGSNNKPSPSSTTLEDVLDSLLGLPSSGRAPSPSLQGRRPV